MRTAVLLVALVWFPGIGLAQAPDAFTLDKAQITACIETQESPVPPPRIEIAARNCTGLQRQQCFEAASKGNPYSIANGQCAVQELELWQQLLKDAHDTAMATLAEADANRRKAGFEAFELMVPKFVEAHEAWERSARADCQYERQGVIRGTARFYAYENCAIQRTAARVFYYRRLPLY
jgi:uncharacterized protein YecT (DUF1311 family)